CDRLCRSIRFFDVQFNLVARETRGSDRRRTLSAVCDDRDRDRAAETFAKFSRQFLSVFEILRDANFSRRIVLVKAIEDIPHRFVECCWIREAEYLAAENISFS